MTHLNLAPLAGGAGQEIKVEVDTSLIPARPQPSQNNSALPPNRRRGKVCPRHPELGGLRRTTDRQCLECRRVRRRAYQQTPEVKGKRSAPEFLKKCRARPRPDRALWRRQKVGAAQRGIEFLLTFEEWRGWWVANLGPNWRAMRGRTHDQYVMARINDTGPYALGNIECVLAGDNIRARNARPKQKLSFPIEFRPPNTSEGRAYRGQRRVAARRGIAFLIPFKAWVAWWEANLGPDWFSKRGTKYGQYVMGRIGDAGPYALNNIKCITNAENTREAHVGKRHTPETIAQIKATHFARIKVQS